MNGQIALFDGKVRPDSVEYLALCQDAVTVRDKKAQDVEGSGTQDDVLSITRQLPLFLRQDEFAEAEGWQ